jgi:hypothetical protein
MKNIIVASVLSAVLLIGCQQAAPVRENSSVSSSSATSADSSGGTVIMQYEDFSGKDIVGSFSLSASFVEDQTLYSVTIGSRGSIAEGNVQDMYLTDSQGKKLSTTVAQGKDHSVTLPLDPPFTILAGSKENFEIHANVKSSGDIEMFFEMDTDIFAVGSLHGYGVTGELYGSPVKIEGKPHSAHFE